MIPAESEVHGHRPRSMTALGGLAILSSRVMGGARRTGSIGTFTPKCQPVSPFTMLLTFQLIVSHSLQRGEVDYVIVKLRHEVCY